MTRPVWVEKVIHGKMGKKFKFKHLNIWYMDKAESVLENKIN